MPHLVPISPQCKMNFSSTGANPPDFDVICSLISTTPSFVVYATSALTQQRQRAIQEIQIENLHPAAFRARLFCSSTPIQFLSVGKLLRSLAWTSELACQIELPTQRANCA